MVGNRVLPKFYFVRLKLSYWYIYYIIPSIQLSSILLYYITVYQWSAILNRRYRFYKLYRINSSQILNVNAKSENIWEILGRLGLSEFGKSALDSDNSRTTGPGISQ